MCSSDLKLAPALLAGCTVVIKPASPTPLSIRFIVDAAQAAGVPAGVINLLTGSGRFGDAIVRHPGVDKIAFTGSTEVGRKIAAACGEQLRPVTLELGGKSAAIILDDADVASTGHRQPGVGQLMQSGIVSEFHCRNQASGRHEIRIVEGR